MFEHRLVDYIAAPFLWLMFSADWLWFTIFAVIQTCSFVVFVGALLLFSPLVILLIALHTVDKYLRPGVHAKKRMSFADIVRSMFVSPDDIARGEDWAREKKAHAASSHEE